MIIAFIIVFSGIFIKYIEISERTISKEIKNLEEIVNNSSLQFSENNPVKLDEKTVEKIAQSIVQKEGYQYRAILFSEPDVWVITGQKENIPYGDFGPGPSLIIDHSTGALLSFIYQVV